MNLAIVKPLAAAVLFLLQYNSFPTPTPALPSPTPSPGLPYGQKPLPPIPMAQPSAGMTGPLAQLAWLAGPWVCSGGTKMTFTFDRGGTGISESIASPDGRAEARLSYSGGRWIYDAVAGGGAYRLYGEDVDVTAAYMDLRGRIAVPGGSADTRLVRRRSGARSFDQMTSIRVGAGEWQQLPVRSCKHI